MAREFDILRQNYGQLVFRHRYRIAIIAVDNRDGRTPIALS